MARASIIQRIALEGADEIKRALADIGKAGEQALRQIQDAGKGTDFAKEFTGEFAKVEEAAHKFGNAIREVAGNVAGNITNLATAAAKITSVATAVGTAIFTLSKSAANAADELRDNALRAGQTTQQYQRLQHAFELSGVKGGKLGTVFALLSQKIAEAQEKGVTSVGAFARIGVTLTDAGGRARSATDILSDVADKMAEISDPADRAALAVALFSRRAGPQLVELLSGGSKAIRELGDDAQRLGLILSDAEVKLGDEMNDALTRFSGAVGATRTRLGLLFAPIFVEGANRLAEAVAALQPQILALGEAVASRVAPVFRDLVSALVGEPDKIQSSFIFVAREAVVSLANVVRNIVVPVIQGWIVILQQAANAFNAVFGTNVSAGDLAMFVLVTRLVGVFGTLLSIVRAVGSALTLLRVAGLIPAAAAFGPVGLAIAAVGIALGVLIVTLARLDWGTITQAATGTWQSILAGAVSVIEALRNGWTSLVGFLDGLWEQVKAAPQQAWEAIRQGASELWESLVQLWNDGATALGQLWEQIKAVPGQVWEAIRQGASELWISITGFWKSGVDAVIGFLTRLRDFALGVWNAIAEAARQAFGAEQQATGASKSFARGGAVFGPGGETSDSIPAWLSSGEFVIRAAAVRKYGLSLFDALNRMRLDPDAFSRFAEGGLVRSLQLMMPQPMRFADGGLASAPAGTSALRPINLTIGADTFAGLLAPEDVAQKLVRVAVGQQIRSAGRRPRAFGSGR